MNKPKFCVGEIVDVVSERLGYQGTGEVTWSKYGVFLELTTGELCECWCYLVDGAPSPAHSNLWDEVALRKRPDLHEPFSIEALKQKYQPEPA